MMDAVGCEQATIFGSGFTAMSGLVLAADYPERVRSLVIVNGAARMLWAPDYPAGARLEPRRSIHDGRDRTRTRSSRVSTSSQIMAPSVAKDEAFRTWWDAAGNRAASPSMARRVGQALVDGDARDKLPLITAPTLVMHRADTVFHPGRTWPLPRRAHRGRPLRRAPRFRRPVLGGRHRAAARRRDEGVRHRQARRLRRRARADHHRVHRHRRLERAGRRGSATTTGEIYSTATTTRSAESSNALADAKSTRQVTVSSRPSAARASPSTAPRRSSIRSGP